MRTWRIDKRGDVPEWARLHEYGCPNCGLLQMLPVVGTVIAETSDGSIIFDNDQTGVIPEEITCRGCRRTFTNRPESDEAA